MDAKLHYRPAIELARDIRAGAVSPIDAVDEFFDRIDEKDEEINAFVDLYHDDARKEAKAAEEAIAAGEKLGPLHGVPIAIKDNIPVKGKQFTNGSVALKDNVAEDDDVTVKLLKEAGAIIIGKTNTPEFATKCVTDNKLFGPTGTPFDPSKMAGGSSGGSAAATAAGMAAFTLGTDGGGSARIPASACGIFGMKPTFGRLPTVLRPNGFGHHYPMRGKGPQTRTVADGALVLDILKGHSAADPFSLPNEDVSYLEATQRSIHNLKIAYSTDLGVFPIDDRVRKQFKGAVDDLRDSGAELVETEPSFEFSREEMLESWMSGFYVVLAEALDRMEDAGMDPFGEQREEFEPTNIESAEMGLEMSAVEYRRQNVVRTQAFEAIQELFEEFDLLVTPTLAVPPFEHGKWGPEEINGEPVDPTIGWCLTWLFNLTGHPAASVPAGFTDEGLPVGMQIIGPRFDDDVVIAASASYERLSPWHDEYQNRIS